MSAAENVIEFCKSKLQMELTEYDEFTITGTFNRIDSRREAGAVVEHNAFEEAAKLEAEWKQIPGYAEFEVTRKGEVRNVLTKLPLKAFGTATRKEAFMLRADDGTKRMIYIDWILQQTFQN